jgi:hypothetical protein
MFTPFKVKLPPYNKPEGKKGSSGIALLFL